MFQTVFPSIIKSSKLHIVSDQYLTLYVQFWATDSGRKHRLKHVERLTEINKLWNVVSCWLYSANELLVFVDEHPPPPPAYIGSFKPNLIFF